ncbi:methyltransferase domain-containing protein [Amorphoplanes nipponensis]|uniref:Ubiquinone biosynthesis protein n=1 Tax=Actinoplanes nipponensis TaxID=135950 RepID=A0A919MUI2_9ACTN|nr:methyltransferase domain-containing protein [Actinoplanes nipponensis]GIE50165.1 ubiquinone biosynthesis protein [Actinoplanes nipponensis]
MIDGALPYLRCPVCGQGLDRGGEQALRCRQGHSFDIARQGYVNLSAGRSPHPGDSAEMIADRAAFLAEGHYDFIAAALAETVRPDDGLVLDAGTGTGSYLARVLDARPAAPGLGIDVSKPALRRAARCHPRAGAALADLWRPLPLADASVAVLLNVFAPRNGPEFHRILRPDGVLLVVTPAPDHLKELVRTHGLLRVDPAKAGRVADTLGDQWRADGTTTHRRTLHLTAAAARTLIGMTPSARHVAPDRLRAADITATAAIDLTVYRPA